MLEITEINFSSGTKWKPTGLNIFVGPNNAGKSRVLKDIVNCLTAPSAQRVAISSIEHSYRGGASKAISSLFPSPQQDEYGNAVMDYIKCDFSEAQSLRTNMSAYKNSLIAETQATQLLFDNSLNSALIAHLTTASRLSLVNKKINKAGNVMGPGSLIESAYEADQNVLEKLNVSFCDAFGYDLVLDKTKFAEAQFELMSKTGTDKSFLDDQGDGVRAFAGITVATGLSARPIVLIDEPETFLHPPQAYLVGQAIANLSGSSCQIFVATHSAEVLRGLTSTSAEASIVRLARKGTAFCQKELASSDLEEINSNPVARSARVLDGIFFDGVIITESDGDDVLYRTVAANIKERPSIHFVNSYSKAASPQIAAVYSKIGVPYCAITDFDMIRVSHEFENACKILNIDFDRAESCRATIEKSVIGSTSDSKILSTINSELSKLCEAIQRKIAGSDEDKRQALREVRAELKKCRDDATAWKEFKRRGVAALDDEAAIAFTELDKICKERGLFIVPVGEREAWLPDSVPYTSNKKKWTKDALEWLSLNEITVSHRLRSFLVDVVDNLRN